MTSAAGVHWYRAFGLTIASEFELPELEPGCAGAPQIQVRRRAVEGTEPGKAAPTYDFSPDSQLLSWPQVASFRIHGSDVIDVDPDPANEGLFRLPLLGPVFGLVLHLKGFLTLHGSALDVNGTGAVFLGDKGAGKSTTAAALVAAGHPLVTDDLVALDFADPDQPRIQPAFPQMKLVNDAAEALHIPGAVTMPKPIAEFPKEQQRLNGSFSSGSIAPGRIYILQRGDELFAEPLPPHSALSALMRFTYAVRFQERRFSPEETAAHFRQCSILATRSRVIRLQAPRGLERLSELVDWVEQDCV